MQSYGQAKDRVASDVKQLIADTEELLRAVGADSKEKVAALRPRVEAAVAQARTRLNEMEGIVEQRGRVLADAIARCDLDDVREERDLAARVHDPADDRDRYEEPHIGCGDVADRDEERHDGIQQREADR